MSASIINYSWLVCYMLEKFNDALQANVDILTFFSNQMGILGVDLDKINLDDDSNFDEDDPETIFHVIFLAWHNKFEKCKAFLKDISEELTPVAGHPTRWWNWYLPQDEKTETETIFADKVREC